MSSTFKELYSDFQDRIKIYTERLDVTEFSFMRMYSSGINILQRDTKICEAQVILDIDPVRQVFVIPNDVLEIIDIHDSCGRQILLQDYKQFVRNVELGVLGKRETPEDYAMKIAHPKRMVMLFDRDLSISPYQNDTQLIFRYHQNFEPISANSQQWAPWFPFDVNFMKMFTSTSVYPTLSPYERAFTDYAVADYVRGRGHPNYKVFEASFEQAKQMAIINKPVYFKQGMTEYYMAPWS